MTRGQDLVGKYFSGKPLIKQDFKTSILRPTNFKGAKLRGASFFDPDLTGADLSDADLRGADFSLANVTKVPQFRCVIREQMLSLTITFVHLLTTNIFNQQNALRYRRGLHPSYGYFWKRGHHLCNTLEFSSLEGAPAIGNTSFWGSDKTGSDFTDVPLREDQWEYLCKVADRVNLTTGNATRDTLLCQ